MTKDMCLRIIAILVVGLANAECSETKDNGVDGDSGLPETFWDAGLLGVWHDETTGLDWEDPPGTAIHCGLGGLSWFTAEEYCRQLGKGWRIPTIDEMRSLIRYCPNTELGGACGVADPDCLEMLACSRDCEDCGTRIPGQPAPNEKPPLKPVCGDEFWSSSPVIGAEIPSAWMVITGYLEPISKSSTESVVRCVRSGSN